MNVKLGVEMYAIIVKNREESKEKNGKNYADS